MAIDVSVDVTNEVMGILGEGLSTAKEPVAQGGIPDGDWTGEFRGFTLGKSKKNETPYMNFNFSITGPLEEYVGADVSAHFNMIAGTKNFDFLKKTLRSMGVRSDNPDDILTALNERVGQTYRLTAKNKEGFFNLYVNGLVR